MRNEKILKKMGSKKTLLLYIRKTELKFEGQNIKKEGLLDLTTIG